MKQKISFKKQFYEKLNTDIPVEVYIEALKETKELKESEDYFFVGSDVFIYLKAALFLIGRFSITENLENIAGDIELLGQPEKKKFSGLNDDRLPQLNSTEQEWNDKIIPIVKENAKFLKLEFGYFLSLIYKEMDVNWYAEIGSYLDKVHLPDANVTKLRVVTCNKSLRIKFENTMSNLMSEAKYRKIG